MSLLTANIDVVDRIHAFSHCVSCEEKVQIKSEGKPILYQKFFCRDR